MPCRIVHFCRHLRCVGISFQASVGGDRKVRAIERTIVFRTVTEFSLLALAALLLRGEHRCRASFACIAAVSLFAVFVVFLQDGRDHSPSERTTGTDVGENRDFHLNFEGQVLVVERNTLVTL